MRPQPFEDLNLAIRSFGTSPTLYGSLEEALAAFLEPEVLDGANQYTCDKCKCSRDAFKGIKLTKLPRVITIGLKRFDFDLATLTRVPPHVHVGEQRGLLAAPQRRSAAAPQRRSAAARWPLPPRTGPPSGAGLAPRPPEKRPSRYGHQGAVAPPPSAHASTRGVALSPSR